MNKIRVLDLLETGGVGGMETLCLNSAQYTAHDHTYLFLWNGGKISDEMIARGYKVEIWNTSVKKYLKDCIRIAMKCRNEKIDAVICHGRNPMIALCAVMIHLLSSHTRILGYVHSSPEDWTKKTIISSRIIFRLAQTVICISDSVLNSVKKYFGYSDKLVRIYNGVEISKFQQKEDDKRPGNRIVYVGRLTEKKGVQIILSALSIVEVSFHLDIVGDGEYRLQLEKMAKNLGLDANVTFHGNQLDVQSFLSKADIFIHVPVLEEGFGLTVVEAMAAGLLCICSKSGALPEIIEDGVTGYLVEKNNPEELAHIIQILIEDYYSDENKRIRANAVKIARKYSIESYSVQIDKLSSKLGGVELIYIGRLEKVKGVQNILKLLAEIEDISYIFRIVGEGSYRQELEKLTSELGIGDKVEFLGMRRDVPELLWQSDVFVHLPEWQEGFGITVIEAMAAGLICIVNDHGALPEIIQDNVNGFVIRKDIYIFKKVLCELADSKRKKESCIDNVREKARERAEDFSIERYVKELEMLLEA